MPTTIEYRAEREIDDLLNALLTEDPSLAKMAECTTVQGCALSRVDDDSGETVASKKEVPVTLKKVPPESRVFARANVHFVLVVDWHWWTNQTDKARTAELKAALLRIEVKKDDKGVVSHAIKPWDIKVTYLELKELGPRNSALIYAVELMQKQQKDMLEMGDACVKRALPPNTEPEPDEEPPRVMARPIPAKTAPVRPVRPARRPAPEPAD